MNTMTPSEDNPIIANLKDGEIVRVAAPSDHVAATLEYIEGEYSIRGGYINAAGPRIHVPPHDVPPRIVDELARINSENETLRAENTVLREAMVRLAGVRSQP